MTIRKNMLKTFFTVVLAIITYVQPPAAAALTVENVTFTDRINIAGQPVPLRNAALLRYMKFIKVYVAALYLPDGVTAESVLSDLPKRLELNYLVAIKGGDFGKGAAPTLVRNHTAAELARLQSRMDKLNAAYKDIRQGDRYALTYQPGKGTELALNGRPLLTIEGADFAAAYFGIWLGREPYDRNLKLELLRVR